MQFMIEQNEPIARDIHRMRLRGDARAFTRPGQFAEFAVPGCFLRRPLSVCDWGEDWFEVIYKVVGGGTDALRGMRAGEALDILTGLGNGYVLRGEAPLLAGGGVGVPPLYGLCKRLKAENITVLLGFGGKDDAFYADEFRALGADVRVSTVDGSAGRKGFVTDLLDDIHYDTIYACGPEPMLRALSERTACGGQYSLEARMACGFGACMGCTIRTPQGAKRVCKDGPVFEKEALPWLTRA